MRVAGFEVESELGRGAMGVVHRAREVATGRVVALKVLPAAFARDPVKRARFQSEGQAMAALRHPGIVAIHGAGVDGGVVWLACELVEGARSLSAAAAGAPLRRRVEWVRDAARALGHAHGRGIVHRDVKPEGEMLVALRFDAEAARFDAEAARFNLPPRQAEELYDRERSANPEVAAKKELAFERRWGVALSWGVRRSDSTVGDDSLTALIAQAQARPWSRATRAALFHTRLRDRTWLAAGLAVFDAPVDDLHPNSAERLAQLITKELFDRAGLEADDLPVLDAAADDLARHLPRWSQSWRELLGVMGQLTLARMGDSAAAGLPALLEERVRALGAEGELRAGASDFEQALAWPGAWLVTGQPGLSFEVRDHLPLDRLQLAARYLQRACDAGMANSMACLVLGRVLVRLGEPQRAVLAIQGAREGGREVVVQAEIALALGDTSRASSLIDEGLRLTSDPTIVRVLMRLQARALGR